MTVKAMFPNGTSLERHYVLKYDATGAAAGSALLAGAHKGELSPEESAKRYGRAGDVNQQEFNNAGGSLSLGTHVGIDIPSGALGKPTTISVGHLAGTAVPPLDPGIINVTAPSDHAYEFLPHGESFRAPVSVRLPYDPALLPPGSLPSEVRTFYFDTTTSRWRALAPPHAVDEKSGVTTTPTDHFTVMINAIVVAPEHPETASFNPNEMQGIKAANPGARIQLVQPPGASSRGDAALGYPLDLPPGRRGLGPQLALRYDSGSGNGWLGMGWSLGEPVVRIDTRWGAPRSSLRRERQLRDSASHPKRRRRIVRPRPRLFRAPSGSRQAVPARGRGAPLGRPPSGQDQDQCAGQAHEYQRAVSQNAR